MSLFERPTQQALIWVKDMASELRTQDAHQALHALRAGLQALRDRLTVAEAAHLSAQLPLIMRGIFFEGWEPSGKPLELCTRSEFLALVREKYAPRADLPADDIVQALFRVLSRHVSEGEITKMMLSLPEEIVELVSGHFREEQLPG